MWRACPRQTIRCRVQLSAHSQIGRLAEEIRAVIHIPALRHGKVLQVHSRHLEHLACALTVTARNNRHAAEFWMIEPEMAFADLTDDMMVAEAMLKHVIRYVLENAPDDHPELRRMSGGI